MEMMLSQELMEVVQSYEDVLDDIQSQIFIRSLNYEKFWRLMSFVVSNRVSTIPQIAAAAKLSPRTVIRYIRLAEKYEDIHASRWGGVCYYVYASSLLKRLCIERTIPVALFVMHDSILQKCVNELSDAQEARTTQMRSQDVKYKMREIKRKWCKDLAPVLFPHKPIDEIERHPAMRVIRICHDLALLSSGRVRPFLVRKGLTSPIED